MLTVIVGILCFSAGFAAHAWWVYIGKRDEEDVKNWWHESMDDEGRYFYENQRP